MPPQFSKQLGARFLKRQQLFPCLYIVGPCSIRITHLCGCSCGKHLGSYSPRAKTIAKFKAFGRKNRELTYFVSNEGPKKILSKLLSFALGNLRVASDDGQRRISTRSCLKGMYLFKDYITAHHTHDLAPYKRKYPKIRSPKAKLQQKKT